MTLETICWVALGFFVVVGLNIGLEALRARTRERDPDVGYHCPRCRKRDRVIVTGVRERVVLTVNGKALAARDFLACPRCNYTWPAPLSIDEQAEDVARKAWK